MNKRKSAEAPRVDVEGRGKVQLSRKQTGSIGDVIALIRRRDLLALAVLVTVTSLTEGVGVLALVPILAGLEGSNRQPKWFTHLVDATGFAPTIGALLIAAFGIAAMRVVLVQVQTMATVRMRNRLVDRLRIAAFAGVLRAEWHWLAQSRASDFGNLILTNVNQVGFGLTSVLALASTAIVGATYLTASLILSWQVTLMTFVVGGLVLAAFAGQRRRSLALGEELGSSRAMFHGFVHQGFAGVRLIKAFGTENTRIAEFVRMVDGTSRQVEEYERASGVSQRSLQIGGLLALTGIVYVGHAVLNVPLSTLLPVLLVFARLVPLVGSIQQNLSSWNYVRPALIETQRLLAETDAHRECTVDPERLPIELHERLTLEGVGTTYEGRDVPALENVSLTLRANTTTAVFGSSGSGKSTLADVVMGLIAPDVGTVAVDDLPIAGNDRIHWRRSIAYVQQEALLFHDTIRANLLIDRADVGEADIHEALSKAGADFVFSLPQGLETVVGDGGMRLSGGERQRIALARALIGRPALLILDEATSALDPENEAAVRRTMAELRGAVTLLFISHRTSMQEDADQVVKLDAGRMQVMIPYRSATLVRTQRHSPDE